MMFPQMTFWLPAEEGAQLRFEFETELAVSTPLHMGKTFMAEVDQPDRFQWARQLDVFGGEAMIEPAATPERIARDLHELLAEARAAETMPITADRGLFALLSFWLPEEKSARLRFEFETELARLEAA